MVGVFYPILGNLCYIKFNGLDSMIQKLMLKDISILHKELNSLSEQDKRFFNPFEFTIKSLKGLLKKTKDHYYVMIADGKIIGFSQLRTFNKYNIPTYGGVIWKRYRDRRYGTIMLKETLSEAKHIGYKRIKLKVDKNNFVAMSIYKKCGFCVIGEEENNWWMDWAT